MAELVCDMTGVCKSHLSSDKVDYLNRLVKNEDDELKSFVSEIVSNKFAFDSDHYYNIPFEMIQEGDILIADVSRIMAGSCVWKHIQIDHIYRNVMFYTVIDDGVDDKYKEGFFQKGSLFFDMMIYPCYIVKHKDYTITCDCPLVKIVDSIDEIAGDYRAYDYKIREERDY